MDDAGIDSWQVQGNSLLYNLQTNSGVS